MVVPEGGNGRFGRHVKVPPERLTVGKLPEVVVRDQEGFTELTYQRAKVIATAWSRRIPRY